MTKKSLSDQRAVRSYLEAVLTAGIIPDGLDGLERPAGDPKGFDASVRDLAEKVLAAERDGESGEARRLINLDGVELDRHLLDNPQTTGGRVVTSADVRAAVDSIPRGF